jgi:hypothetical protein
VSGSVFFLEEKKSAVRYLVLFSEWLTKAKTLPLGKNVLCPPSYLRSRAPSRALPPQSAFDPSSAFARPLETCLAIEGESEAEETCCENQKMKQRLYEI